MAPMILHELTEFESVQKKEDECLEALLKELKIVPENKILEYVRFRREVFKHLIGFLEQHEPTSAFLPEAKKSLNYLERL